MKAAVFYKKGDIRYVDVKKPSIKSDEVLVQVKACGVCGTDVHFYEGAAGAGDPKLENIIGHEFSGIIAEVGDKVQDINIGDKVAVNPNVCCGKCYYCKIGKEHFCQNRIGLGTTENGGFAEYCAVPEKAAYKVKDDLPFELAAMAEPIACCLNGIDRSKIKAGGTVLIIGGGTIGLLMTSLAKKSGASKVIVCEPIEAKRNLALDFGADIVLDPFEDSLDEYFDKNSINIDVSIECVGRKETILDAIKYTGLGGNVMLFGLTDPDCEVPFKPYEIFLKELTITSSFINPYTQSRAVAILESGEIDIDALIYKKVSLSEINKVFENKMYRQGKILVLPDA